MSKIEILLKKIVTEVVSSEMKKMETRLLQTFMQLNELKDRKKSSIPLEQKTDTQKTIEYAMNLHKQVNTPKSKKQTTLSPEMHESLMSIFGTDENSISTKIHKYTENPVLNELLNSTNPVNYQEMGDLVQYADDVQMDSFNNLPSLEKKLPEKPGVLTSVDAALNVDYSKFLKKVDESVKNTRPV